MNETKENKVEVEQKENNRRNYPIDSFHPFFSSFFNDYFGDTDEGSMMKTDILDEGEAYKIEVELPGVNKQDVKISLEKGYLTVSAKVNSTNYDGHAKKIHRERFYGTYKRSYYVGEGIVKEGISAKMDLGILTITVNKPKKLEESEKFIQID